LLRAARRRPLPVESTAAGHSAALPDDAARGSDAFNGVIAGPIQGGMIDGLSTAAWQEKKYLRSAELKEILEETYA